MSQVQTRLEPPPQGKPSLTEAFSAFNELSSRLSDAYGQLQSEVSLLSDELAQTRAQRQREQVQKQQLADRLTALLEALPAAVVLVDGRDRVDRFNPAAEALFRGLSWGRLWHEICEDSVLTATDTGEWVLRGERRINVSRRELGDGGQILVMVDMTEQRQLEQRLQRQDRLSEMGELAAQLAHQVRTPLSTALLYGGQLGKPGLSDDQRSRFASQLLEGLRHTEKLVSDMLAFSRGGHFLTTSIHCREVVERAVDALQVKAKALGANLEVELTGGDDRMLGNRDALIGVIGNLIDNSLSHGEGCPLIRVSLELDERYAVIRVQDDGPGIPSDIEPRIFDPFFTTRERGTGLGLAVAQVVTLAHGGRIAVTRPRAAGACFELSLPLQQGPQQGESR